MPWSGPGPALGLSIAVLVVGESQVLNIYICLISPMDCHVYMFNMSPAYTQLRLVLIQTCHALDGQ